MEETKIKEIEQMREKMVQATNDAALTVMGLNNELSELEVYLKKRYNSYKKKTINSVFNIKKCRPLTTPARPKLSNGVESWSPPRIA